MLSVLRLFIVVHASLSATGGAAEAPCALIVTAAGESLDRLSSPYLSEGFKAESYRISDVVVSPAEITGLVSIQSGYSSPTDQGFHLSAVTALALESQLAIAGYLASRGLTAKPGEVWMASYQHRYRRPIRTAENLRLTLKYREEPQRTSLKQIVHFEINWEERAFTGVLTLVFENVASRVD